jgi:hypothetical protein
MRGFARAGFCGIVLLICSAPACGALVQLVGPEFVVIDGSPATAEPPIVFELVVVGDLSPLAVGFQWDLDLLGAIPGALSFDVAAGKAATRAIAADVLRDPLYMLAGDSDGFEASLVADRLRGGDFSASLSEVPVLGRSLGQVHLRIDDEAIAEGLYLLDGPGSFLVLDIAGTTELIDVLPGVFHIVVPEPTTLAILAAGSVALIRRRRVRA